MKGELTVMKDGVEYTIGKITDDTVEVIRWHNGKPAYARTVEYQDGDTVGDAIAKAFGRD